MRSTFRVKMTNHLRLQVLLHVHDWQRSEAYEKLHLKQPTEELITSRPKLINEGTDINYENYVVLSPRNNGCLLITRVQAINQMLAGAAR